MVADKSEVLREAAESLRASIGEWFGVTRKNNLVLAPGILIGLRIFLQATNARKLLITADEYYSAQHFAGIQTICCDAANVEREVARQRPDAVLMSVVSWRGKPLDVEGTFGRLRLRRRPNSLLLIADYAHAGATGFPCISTLNADIVAGDINKWVTPPGLSGNVAFLHFDTNLKETVQEAFRSFYLATAQSLDLAARWLPTTELLNTQRWIRDSGIKREDLLRQYAFNREMAEALSRASEMQEPGSCIVWPSTANALVRKLAKEGLVWRRHDGIRVLCRDLTALAGRKKTSTQRARRENRTSHQGRNSIKNRPH